MPRRKLDGIIEAVRYTPEGMIDTVRAYLARGAVWSDHVLLGRTDLVELLKAGRKFSTGQRKLYTGSALETGEAVRYNKDVISTGGGQGAHDLLTGVPIY
jgi:hypothetical protein